MRISAVVACCVAFACPRAAADEPRQPPPDPAHGDRYDGQAGDPSHRAAALAMPRVILFPFRLVFWALDPPTRYALELEERYHIYQRIYDLTTTRDGLIGVRPELHWSLDFKPAFGARFFDDRAFGYETSLRLYATGGPDNARGEIWARPTPYSWPVQLTIGSVYDRRNDRLFAGVDNTTPVQPGQLGPSRYLSDNVDVDVTVSYRVLPPLILWIGGSFGWRHYGDGEALNDPPIGEVYCVRNASGMCIPGTIDQSLVPGFVNGTRYFRGAAGLTLDMRDSAVHETMGFLLNVGADYSHGIAGDDSSYYRLFGSAALPINLWAHRHVILFRVATETATPTGNQPIPFDQLPTLGGPDDLRGFRDQLLRGHTSLIGTVEYRFPVWMWVDADVFADYGGVFQKWYGGFGASRMQPDLGFGLRMFNRDSFWLRVQVAYGWGEGWRVTISTRSWK